MKRSKNFANNSHNGRIIDKISHDYPIRSGNYWKFAEIQQLLKNLDSAEAFFNKFRVVEKLRNNSVKKNFIVKKLTTDWIFSFEMKF